MAALAGIASAPTTGADAARPRAHVLQPGGRAALLATAAHGRASRQMLQGPRRPSPSHSSLAPPLLEHTHTCAAVCVCVVGVLVCRWITYECMRVCLCLDRRAYMARCDGQLGHGCCCRYLCITASPDCVPHRSCMRAGVCACDPQSRHRRRLDRRRSRRPFSAVTPVSHAPHVRRSNLCARARLRVDATPCVFARCAMLLTRACVRPVCLRACVQLRATACVRA